MCLERGDVLLKVLFDGAWDFNVSGGICMEVFVRSVNIF